MGDKTIWGHLEHCYMYEIPLSGSTDNLAQMAQKVSHMLLKLSLHLLSTEECFPNEYHPCDSIGDSPQVWQRCYPSYI